MKVIINLEIHAYAEERLCDEVFDSPPSYGILGPQIMVPLLHNRNKSFAFLYDDKTKVDEAIAAIENQIWGNDVSRFKEFSPLQYYFMYNNERYSVSNPSHSFQDLLMKYFDPKDTGAMTAYILVCCDAGDVGTQWPLRFYVNSHEAGRHHEAHIHVRDVRHRYEASIRISDGEIIAGKLPAKLARLAKEKILADQEYFYYCWNTMTDGLKVDINHHYHITNY